MKRDRAFVWNDQNKTIRSGKKIPLFVCFDFRFLVSTSALLFLAWLFESF